MHDKVKQRFAGTHYVRRYMYFVRLMLLGSLLPISTNSLASNVFDIDKTRVLQIATDAVYLKYDDLESGDIDRKDDLLLIHCYLDEECRALVDFRVVPTIIRTTRQEEDGRCWEKFEYDTVSVRVFPSGKYLISRYGQSGSSNSHIDCEHLE